jgi:DEAD/DEAH box helicase domain-containing protein
MIDEVIFDVETQRLFSEVEGNEPGKLGISIVSLYIRQVSDDQREINGEMKSFWEHELDSMWPYFTSAKRIIGFNTIKFDVPALIPYAPDNFAKLPHFDMMQTVRSKLGHYLSLKTLGENTLGRGKTDVGTNAVEYWKAHDPESLEKLKFYCEADVALTRDLYDYGVQNKQLKYLDNWNTVQSFDVDFSYPKEVIDASRQMGMF